MLQLGKPGFLCFLTCLPTAAVILNTTDGSSIYFGGYKLIYEASSAVRLLRKYLPCLTPTAKS